MECYKKQGPAKFHFLELSGTSREQLLFHKFILFLCGFIEEGLESEKLRSIKDLLLCLDNGVSVLEMAVCLVEI